jgi:DNA-binding MarR family transcriptional regulator
VINQNSITPLNPEVSVSASLTPSNHDDRQLPLLDLLNEINAVAIKLRQRGKPEHETGISGAEHAVLDIINRQGAATVPQIARERFTSRQNIQILVDRLGNEGHVMIVGNPAHKRSVLVCLTEQGKTWLREDERSRKLLYLEIGALFSGEEVSVLRSALRKLHAALGRGTSQTQIGVENPSSASSRASERPKAAPRTRSPRTETEDQFPVNLL